MRDRKLRDRMEEFKNYHLHRFNEGLLNHRNALIGHNDQIQSLQERITELEFDKLVMMQQFQQLEKQFQAVMALTSARVETIQLIEQQIAQLSRDRCVLLQHFQQISTQFETILCEFKHMQKTMNEEVTDKA